MKNKNLLLIVSLFFTSLIVVGQAPQKIDFQAMARDASGNPLLMQTIGVRISIYEGGSSVYAERHTPQTDDYGLFMLHIGDGTPLSGNFNSIDWSLGNHSVKVEVDPNGGYAYVNMGTSQLTSAPYALYGEDEDADPNNELQTLSIVGNDLTISDGNTVTLPGGGGSSLWTQNGDDIYYDAGKVGIGLSSPEGSLHVAKSAVQADGVFGEDIGFPSAVDVSIGNTTDEALLYVGQSTGNKGFLAWAYDPTPEDAYFALGAYGGNNALALQPVGGNVGINEVEPEASLDVNGTTKLGPAGTVFSEIKEFTGTTDASTYYTHATLPAGYNENNTRILSLEINYNGDRWSGLANDNLVGANRNTSYIINELTLTIYYPDMNIFKNRAFRVILMKTGAAKDADIQLIESQAFGSSDE